MKISSTKRLVSEDFPKDGGWNTLIPIINPFIEQVYYGLVNGLTLKDNLKAQIYKFTYYKDAPSTQTFRWALNELPTSLVVGQIYNTASGGAVPPYSFTWQALQNGQIQFTFNGLLTTDEYQISLTGQV